MVPVDAALPTGRVAPLAADIQRVRGPRAAPSTPSTRCHRDDDQQLVAHYEVDLDTAKADVAEFLKLLDEHHMLERAD